MWFSLALLLATGQLPNPLMAFARDGSEHPISFKGPSATFEGVTYEFVGRNRFALEADAGGCDGATPELTRTVLDLRPDKVELKVTQLARPCRGREKAVNVITRHFSYQPPEGRCSTQPLTYTQGERTLTVRDGCDDTVTLSDGTHEWTLSGNGRRFQAGSGRAAIRLDGVPGDSALRVTSKVVPAGAWALRSE